MPTVRINDDLYKEITDLAVKATIARQAPIKQAQVIHALLWMKFHEYTKKELLEQYVEYLKHRTRLVE